MLTALTCIDTVIPMSNPPKPIKRVNFGPIRLDPETLDELHKARGHRSAASIVRELIEIYIATRKKKQDTP
jgi:hypothetical protein